MRGASLLRLSLALVATGLASPALAHAGHVHAGDPLPWTWDPWITVPLAVSAGLYGLGVARLWRRAGFGRGVRSGRAVMFAAGWLALAVALVSPLHALGERLFTAHMIEHEMLMVVAAPLMALARPIGAMLWGLPQGWRRGLGGAARARPFAAFWHGLTDPLTATILHGVAIWAWHMPALFEAALASEWVHGLQHASFLFSALLFWWALIHGRASRHGYGPAVGHLFTTTLHTGVLGALFIFSGRLWYPPQADEAARWGLTALQDQQLAGLVMSVPACAVYPVAGLVLAGLWISQSGRMGRIGPGHVAHAP
jgi:cytochrome c oxidase assembly factor CtaG